MMTEMIQTRTHRFTVSAWRVKAPVPPDCQQDHGLTREDVNVGKFQAQTHGPIMRMVVVKLLHKLCV